MYIDVELLSGFPDDHLVYFLPPPFTVYECSHYSWAKG